MKLVNMAKEQSQQNLCPHLIFCPDADSMSLISCKWGEWTSDRSLDYKLVLPRFGIEPCTMDDFKECPFNKSPNQSPSES